MSTRELRRKCAKCHITSEENANLRFHRFPLPGKHGSLKARVWAEFCYPSGNWSSLESLKKIYKQHKMLCSKHFSVSAYTSTSKERLNKFAIPVGAEVIISRLREEQCLPSASIDSYKDNSCEPSDSTTENYELLKNAEGTIVSQSKDKSESTNLSLSESEARLNQSASYGEIHYDEDNLYPEPSDTSLLQEIDPQNENVGGVVPKQEIFSWNKQRDLVDISQDENDNDPDNLSMYCDDDGVSQVVKDEICKRKDGRFQCDICRDDIFGFRYTCVQCHNFDLCAACEAKGSHDEHYMLRVPETRPNKEVQFVLARIRRYLLEALNPILTEGLDDDVSVKSEVKSEAGDDEHSELHVEDFQHHESGLHSRASSYGTENTMDSEPEETEPNKYRTQINELTEDNELVLSIAEHRIAENTSLAHDTGLDTSVEQEEHETNVTEQEENEINVDPFGDLQPAQPSTAKRKNVYSISKFVEPIELSPEAKKKCITPHTTTSSSSNTTAITTRAQGIQNVTIIERTNIEGSKQKMPVIKIQSGSVRSPLQSALTKSATSTKSAQNIINLKEGFKGLVANPKLKIIKLAPAAMLKLGQTVPGKCISTSEQETSKMKITRVKTINEPDTINVKTTKLKTISGQETKNIKTTELKVTGEQDTNKIETNVLNTNKTFEMTKIRSMNPQVKLVKLSQEVFDQEKIASERSVSPVISTQELCNKVTASEVRKVFNKKPRISLEKLPIGALMDKRETASQKTYRPMTSKQELYKKVSPIDVRKALSLNPQLKLQKISPGSSISPMKKVANEVLPTSKEVEMKVTTNMDPKFYPVSHRANILRKPSKAVSNVQKTVSLQLEVSPSQPQTREENTNS